MAALETMIGACLMLVAVSIAACSDRSGPEDAGRSSAALSGGEPDWKLVRVGDFNRDSLQDLLWYDSERGLVRVWLMRGTVVMAKGPEIPGPIGDGWAALTAGDFNRDGMNDLQWYNATTNQTAIWLMRGTGILREGPEIPDPFGAGRSAARSGDFNRDGLADLLWYDPSANRMVVWFMAGTRVMAQGPEMAGPEGGGWKALEASDFNRDGLADVLWYNPTTNRMTAWLMAGTRVLDQGPEIPGPEGEGWIASSASDFDFDGMADVIWFNPTTNRMAVWLMDKTIVREQGPEIPGPAGVGWNLAFVGDQDGDRMADVVWLSSTMNAITVWTMHGTHVARQGPLIPIE